MLVGRFLGGVGSSTRQRLLARGGVGKAPGVKLLPFCVDSHIQSFFGIGKQLHEMTHPCRIGSIGLTIDHLVAVSIKTCEICEFSLNPPPGSGSGDGLKACKCQCLGTSPAVVLRTVFRIMNGEPGIAIFRVARIQSCMKPDVIHQCVGGLCFSREGAQVGGLPGQGVPAEGSIYETRGVELRACCIGSHVPFSKADTVTKMHIPVE